LYFLDFESQLLLMIVAIVLGLLTGFLFDIYRRIRNAISPGLIITALGDLCFWVIITFITFYSLLKINFGQVRGYLFFGLAVGLYIYFCIFSPFVIKGFVLLSIFIEDRVDSIIYYKNRVKKLRFFSLPKRIIDEVKRINSKIKRK
jgi:spore cortex biosynthesis protein YabQ